MHTFIYLSNPQRLASKSVIPLLSRVIGKLEARPQRARLLVQWIRTVLDEHAALLMSSPGQTLPQVCVLWIHYIT